MRKIIILALLAAFLALPGMAMAAAYGGFNGTTDGGAADTGSDEFGTRTWYFNATTPGNNTAITVTFPFFEWCTQCKFWVQPNPRYNSTAEEQTWSTPASGTLYFGDTARNNARNQTVSGSVDIPTRGSVVVDGPAKSWTFEPRNLADNRTVTVEGYCTR